MPTMKDVRRVARKMGVHLDVPKPRGMLDVTAIPPEGKQFATAGGLEVLVAHQLHGRPTEEVLQDLLDRMGEGLEDV